MKFVPFLILLFATQIQAETYYVAKTGSDATGCALAVNPNTPKFTITSALACVGKTLGAGAGKVVEVAAGIYVERIDSAVSPFPSGVSWNRPFTLRAKPGDTVVIKNSGEFNIRIFSNPPQYSIISGFTLDGSNLLQDSSQIALGSCCNGGNYIRLQNLRLVNNVRTHGILIGRFTHHSEVLNSVIHGGGFVYNASGSAFTYPIYLEGSNNLFDGIELYDFPRYGIHAYSGYPEQPNANIIRNCKIHDYGWAGFAQMAGVLIYGGNANQVYGCSIWNGPNPILIRPGATNTEIRDNLFVPPVVTSRPSAGKQLSSTSEATGP